ncbi:uncharacterized protein LOC134218368 [Armigeres subalbatus]|uniref:uncharacterized protein LOC134218368 n=1 Tax=Armigeres subalbatus TaxID=124917 RepID=UPI002ED1D4FF
MSAQKRNASNLKKIRAIIALALPPLFEFLKIRNIKFHYYRSLAEWSRPEYSYWSSTDPKKNNERRPSSPPEECSPLLECGSLPDIKIHWAYLQNQPGINLG